MPNNKQIKTELRKHFGQIRKNIENRAHKEKAVFEKLTALLADRQVIFCYVSMGSELSTHEFINSEFYRTILVPHTAGGVMIAKKLISAENLSADKMGNIDQNFTENYQGTPSAVIVPMLAFDKNNYRLGYGGGYYDRYLKDYDGLKIGLAFDEQYGELCIESFDMPLDIIITPTQIRKRQL